MPPLFLVRWARSIVEVTNPDTGSKKQITYKYSMEAHIMVKESKYLNFNEELQM